MWIRRYYMSPSWTETKAKSGGMRCERLLDWRKTHDEFEALPGDVAEIAEVGPDCFRRCFGDSTVRVRLPDVLSSLDSIRQWRPVL